MKRLVRKGVWEQLNTEEGLAKNWKFQELSQQERYDVLANTIAAEAHKLFFALRDIGRLQTEEGPPLDVLEEAETRARVALVELYAAMWVCCKRADLLCDPLSPSGIFDMSREFEALHDAYDNAYGKLTDGIVIELDD